MVCFVSVHGADWLSCSLWGAKLAVRFECALDDCALRAQHVIANPVLLQGLVETTRYTFEYNMAKQ